MSYVWNQMRMHSVGRGLLQVELTQVIGAADGAYALGDLLALSGEVVLLLASRFHLLCNLLQA